MEGIGKRVFNAELVEGWNVVAGSSRGGGGGYLGKSLNFHEPPCLYLPREDNNSLTGLSN